MAKEATVTICWNYLGLEMCAEADITYNPGSKAVMYQRNGDPGWPGDPRELIDVVSMRLVECGNAKVCEDMDVTNIPDYLMERIEEAMADVDEDDGRGDWAYQNAKDRKLEERWS